MLALAAIFPLLILVGVGGYLAGRFDWRRR